MFVKVPFPSASESLSHRDFLDFYLGTRLHTFITSGVAIYQATHTAWLTYVTDCNLLY
jgi:hypothetical protein